MVPETSDMLRIQYPAMDGESVSEWDLSSQQYCCGIVNFSNVWYDDNFDANPGSFLIGQGFVLNAGAEHTWIRTFSVW